jgi:hypothetical protein
VWAFQKKEAVNRFQKKKKKKSPAAGHSGDVGLN